jgi:hypothetical protein
LSEKDDADIYAMLLFFITEKPIQNKLHYIAEYEGLSGSSQIIYLIHQRIRKFKENQKD